MSETFHVFVFSFLFFMGAFELSKSDAAKMHVNIAKRSVKGAENNSQGANADEKTAVANALKETVKDLEPDKINNAELSIGNLTQNNFTTTNGSVDERIVIANALKETVKEIESGKLNNTLLPDFGRCNGNCTSSKRPGKKDNPPQKFTNSPPRRFNIGQIQISPELAINFSIL